MLVQLYRYDVIAGSEIEIDSHSSVWTDFVSFCLHRLETDIQPTSPHKAMYNTSIRHVSRPHLHAFPKRQEDEAMVNNEAYQHPRLKPPANRQSAFSTCTHQHLTHGIYSSSSFSSHSSLLSPSPLPPHSSSSSFHYCLHLH